MSALLDYIVQDYNNGGYVNPFDTSSQPTRSGVLKQNNIDLTDDKYLPFIPTYDQTSEDFLRTNYAQKREGSYSTARDTLGQLGQKSRETKAQQGFAGSGKSLLDTTRKDIVDQFGMDAQNMYTGLQQDITGMRRDYDEQVLAAIGDLPEDAYTMGGTDSENSLEDLPYQGDEITFQGNNAFWNPASNSYIYGTLTEDSEGNIVENIYGDPSDPQTPDGGVNPTFLDVNSADYYPTTNSGQYINLVWPDGTSVKLVWDEASGRYAEYTGG